MADTEGSKVKVIEAEQTSQTNTPMEGAPKTQEEPTVPINIVKKDSIENHLSDEFTTDLSEQFKMASLLAKSGILSKDLNTPEKLFLLLQQGKELGLQPMQSLNNIYVVNGKTAISAKMMLSLAIKAGITYRFVEWTDLTCKMIFKRGEWEMEIDYTMEEAKKANLTWKDNWKSYPKEMLKSRCVSRALGLIAPDIVAGLYEESELIDSIKLGGSGNLEGHIIEVSDDDKKEQGDDQAVSNSVNELVSTITEKANNAKTDKEKNDVMKLIKRNVETGLISESDVSEALTKLNS